MIKAFVSAAVAIGLSLPAQAACVSLPDGPESGNTANGSAYAVCLQEQMALETEQAQQQTQLRLAIEALERQQRELQQRQLSLQQPLF